MSTLFIVPNRETGVLGLLGGVYDFIMESGLLGQAILAVGIIMFIFWVFTRSDGPKRLRMEDLDDS